MNACILNCLSLVVQKISESLNRVMMNSLNWLVIASVFSYLPLKCYLFKDVDFSFDSIKCAVNTFIMYQT